jgi:hypothetical protein
MSTVTDRRQHNGYRIHPNYHPRTSRCSHSEKIGAIHITIALINCQVRGKSHSVSLCVTIRTLFLLFYLSPFCEDFLGHLGCFFGEYGVCELLPFHQNVEIIIPGTGYPIYFRYRYIFIGYKCIAFYL